VKVALISFGFEEYCVQMANGLARSADVMLVLPHDRVGAHLERLTDSVTFRGFAKPRLRQPLRQLRMIRDLLTTIRRFDPDVIHLQGGHLWFNLALPFLRRYPLVVTAHDPRHHVGDRDSQKIPQPILDFGVRRATQVIVHGDQLKMAVVEQCHIPASIVHVVPHVVLGNDAPPPDDHPSTTSVEEDNLVLFFGRIWEYKGLEYLIRAEPLIAEQIPDVRIAIAGHGEDFERYRRMMIRPERFEVHNEYVSHEKRAELFSRASVVTLPYLDASQSGVIPVAYASGKPVVATRVGSLPDLVDDGVTGFLVPPRDEHALANAIVRLLRDRALRKRMGEAGRKKINTECSAEAVAAKTIEVYRRAVSEKNQSAEVLVR
jgi:glycosyltransferase involved in cell wall biosynthesis